MSNYKPPSQFQEPPDKLSQNLKPNDPSLKQKPINSPNSTVQQQVNVLVSPNIPIIQKTITDHICTFFNFLRQNEVDENEEVDGEILMHLIKRYQLEVDKSLFNELEDLIKHLEIHGLEKRNKINQKDFLKLFESAEYKDNTPEEDDLTELFSFLDQRKRLEFTVDDYLEIFPDQIKNRKELEKYFLIISPNGAIKIQDFFNIAMIEPEVVRNPFNY